MFCPVRQHGLRPADSPEKRHSGHWQSPLSHDDSPIAVSDDNRQGRLYEVIRFFVQQTLTPYDIARAREKAGFTGTTAYATVMVG